MTSRPRVAFALAILAMLVTVSDASATDPEAASLDALQTYCRTAPSPCREHLRITLRREGDAPYDQTFDLLPPAVQGGIITVHPGETVRAVPLFDENDAFTGWRAAQDDEPADTQVLTIDLSQREGKIHMMAHVSTNTGPALKLRMGLMRLDSEEPESTSSCPLSEGGFSNFEMWPFPIFVLMVAEAVHPSGADVSVCK